MTENPASKGPIFCAEDRRGARETASRRGAVWRIAAVAVFVVILGIFGTIFLRGGTTVVEVIAARPAGGRRADLAQRQRLRHAASARDGRGQDHGQGGGDAG
jgi:hypothetical protein